MAMQIVKDCDGHAGPSSPTPADPARQTREDAASAQDMERRQTAVREGLFCFVSFSGPDEAVLGLGLHVHPRTEQQRRLRRPPDLDLVCDYVDVEVFNEGVQHAARGAVGRASEWPELPAMVSSARGHLNGWLPLYVNAQHWATARRYAPSAFGLLAARRPGSRFRPRDALDVCCNLLTCAVVGFTKGQCECATPRTAARCRASERAVQMYADVHQLLLQVAREYPEVRGLALARLRSFIQDPAGRTRERAPSLGDLMQCLLITEEVTWEDLLPSLLPEALRRHVARQRAKEKTFSSRDPELVSDKENLVAAWDSFAPQAGMVVSFCAVFYDRVGRPGGCSLEQVEDTYDRRWGRLQENVTRDLMEACARLRQQTSVAGLLLPLLPEGSRGLGWLCEAILWAEKHGYRRVIPAQSWPRPAGPHPMLRRWRAAGRRQGHEQRAWQEEEKEEESGDGLMLAQYLLHDQPWLQPQQGHVAAAVHSAGLQHWQWQQWLEYQQLQMQEAAQMQWLWRQEAAPMQVYGDTGLRFRVPDEPIAG